MDRANWLKEKRRLAEQRMDTLFAPTYDEHWGSCIDATHLRCLDRFLSLCPPGCLILDAACGTGKYWSLILATGRRVFGTDQSRAMLARAREKLPNVPTEKVGLQELDYIEAFDAALCIDAMENIPQEDWPLVLSNCHRATKPDGHFYFTVELAAEEEVERAFVAGQELGLPVVHGEWAHEGGYHCYPRVEQVREWLRLARFRLVEETTGDGYHHFLAQKDR